MKKQVLTVAVVATMLSAVATADLSITGDAYTSYASQAILSPVTEANSKGHLNTNKDTQRLRLKVVGSVGETEVVGVLRNGSQTRADWEAGVERNVNGNVLNEKDLGVKMDELYLTTKIGPVNLKAGDYWGTIGLGAHSKDAAKKNALSASINAGDWKFGVFTANGSADGGSETTNVNASGKLGPVKVGVVHNPDEFTDLTAEATFGGVSIAAEYWDDETSIDNDTTFLQVSGKVGNFKWEIAQLKNDVATRFNPAFEENYLFVDPADPNPDDIIMTVAEGEPLTTTDVTDIPTGDQDNDGNDLYYLLNSSGNQVLFKATESVRGELTFFFVDAPANPAGSGRAFTYKADLSDNASRVYQDSHSTGKLTPLGSMLIGTNARGGTATAAFNAEDFTEILGIALSTEVAGNTVKALYTKNTLGALSQSKIDLGMSGFGEITATELIVSRPLGGGTLTANIGKISGLTYDDKLILGGIKGNATNLGLRLDVKF